MNLAREAEVSVLVEICGTTNLLLQGGISRGISVGAAPEHPTEDDPLNEVRVTSLGEVGKCCIRHMCRGGKLKR